MKCDICKAEGAKATDIDGSIFQLCQEHEEQHRDSTAKIIQSLRAVG